jgi:hypothetical protein
MNATVCRHVTFAAKELDIAAVIVSRVAINVMAL